MAKKNKSQGQPLNKVKKEASTSSQVKTESDVTAAFNNVLTDSQEQVKTENEEVKKTNPPKRTAEEVKRKTPGKYRKFI